MINIDIAKAKNELDELIYSSINNDEIYNISTSNGNVVLLSENHYNSLVESLYLAGIKNVYEDIEEVVNTPTCELIKKQFAN